MAGALTAQIPQSQAPSTKGVVPKGRAPVSKEILKVKVPRAAESDLSNGAHLMVLEDRRAPQVTVQIYIPGAGGYFDPAGKEGLGQGTVWLLTRSGTATKTAEQVEERVANTLQRLDAYL